MESGGVKIPRGESDTVTFKIIFTDVDSREGFISRMFDGIRGSSFGSIVKIERVD